MADFNEPVKTQQYETLLSSIRALFASVAGLLDSRDTDPDNKPANAKRWDDTNARFQSWESSAWLTKLLGIAGGGTGASTASGARTSLGVPSTTDLTDHTGATSVHSAASAATASRLVIRDGSGRAKMAAPAAADDIAIQSTVTDHSSATSVHSAASAATASRLVIRDANGRAKMAAPSESDDLAILSTVTDAIAAAKGVTAGKTIQVDQAITEWTRAATTTLGTTLTGTLSATDVSITAFNGVEGVTYHCRALGAGRVEHHATNLIITQTGANITTAAGDTFDVYMITSATCRVLNYQRASGEALVAASVTFSSSAENIAGTVSTKAVSPLGIRQAFNCSGTAPVFACRAWVNFNGTGTVAIRASGNVSSITDNGTGDYTVNFTTAIADNKYAVSGTAGDSGSSGSIGSISSIYPVDYATGSVQVRTGVAATLIDYDNVSVIVHR